MDGERHGAEIVGETQDEIDQPAQPVRFVDVAGTMDGDDDAGTPRRRTTSHSGEPQRVDDGIADDSDTAGINAFALEERGRRRRGGEVE